MQKVHARKINQLPYSTGMLTHADVCKLLYLHQSELEELVAKGELVPVPFKNDEVRFKFSDLVGMLQEPAWDERKRARG